MEENNTVHPDYQKGFNEGFSIAKFAPEIAVTLSKAQTQSERMKGFKDGRNEFLLEKEKDLPAFLRKDRISSITRKEEKDIDREEKERE